MADKGLYQEQRKRKELLLKKKRRRRIRLIKFYFSWTVVICVFLLILTGVIQLTGRLTRKPEQTGGDYNQAQDDGGLTTISREAAEAAVYGSFPDPASLGYDNEVIDSLLQMVPDNQKIARILSNIGDYPAEFLELVNNNTETADFVLNYPLLAEPPQIREDIDLSDSYSAGSIPLLLQWDTRWGYCQYGEHTIAMSGCGPTCLSMVYVGLTGDTRKNPGVMSQFSKEQGFLDADNNTRWALMTEGAGMLGLDSYEISLDQSVMIRELELGHPIICSMGPGDFTTGGHFIVLYGYKKGKFLVRDPNSKIRSKKKWTYDVLAGQIKNLWAFSSQSGLTNACTRT